MDKYRNIIEKLKGGVLKEEEIELLEKILKEYLEQFLIFPEADGYTKAQLIANRVPDMGYLERMAYIVGHYYGDWLTDEERLDNKVWGWCVYYDTDDILQISKRELRPYRASERGMRI